MEEQSQADKSPPRPPILGLQTGPARFECDNDTKLRISRIFTPAGSNKVVIAWNFVSKDARVTDDEVADAWKRYLSDLPLPPIRDLIRDAIVAARNVSYLV